MVYFDKFSIANLSRYSAYNNLYSTLDIFTMIFLGTQPEKTDNSQLLFWLLFQILLIKPA